MLVDSIILKANKNFSNSIAPWALSNCNNLRQLTNKELDITTIDSLLIFTQNQILTQYISDNRAQFDKLQKPILHIDINGTLAVGTSNLELWIERNKCRSILILGADDLVNNINLERFLNSIN